MKKIDVAIHVYGKPYQTLVTLQTLLFYSGALIDKILFVEERDQREDYNYSIIEEGLSLSLRKYDVKLIKFIPKQYVGTYDIKNKRQMTEYMDNPQDEALRKSLRYQYGMENSTQKYVLTTHNDMVYKGDIVSKFLDGIKEHFCVGLIGQCWSCPLGKENICGHTKLVDMLKNPLPRSEVIDIINKYPTSRTHGQMRKGRIRDQNIFPLPECRVNEWVSLINMDYYRKEVFPNGDVMPLGYSTVDTGDVWFRQMVHKGYTFENIAIAPEAIHSYFNPLETGNGRSSIFNEEKYDIEEKAAKKYFIKLNNLVKYL